MPPGCGLGLSFFSFSGCFYLEYQEHLFAGFPALLGSHSNGVSLIYGPSLLHGKTIYLTDGLFWIFMSGHICSGLESLIKLFIFWSACEACLWWADSPPGSAPLWWLWGMGSSLGHPIWQAATLSKPLLPLCGKGQQGWGARDSWWGGPVEYVYREQSSNSYLQRGKCFLALCLSLGRQVLCDWVNDGAASPCLGLCPYSILGFLAVSTWMCRKRAWTTILSKLGCPRSMPWVPQLLSSCSPFGPLLTLVAFSNGSTHKGPVPVQTGPQERIIKEYQNMPCKHALTSYLCPALC